MKLLLLDNDGEGSGIDLAVRAQGAGHDVRYWTPPKSGPWGDGMIEKIKEWEPSMDWAELIVLSGNTEYTAPLVPYFGKGYPIFGSNMRGAELELDRALGQQVLSKCGVEILPYVTVNNIDEAIAFVKKRPGKPGCAIKPWGGEADKAMTCVARDADEAVFMLETWKRQGLKGHLMLQEKVDGIEMGISGFFGPGGWLSAIEESFEHKKFLNDDLGANTGEMGTVIRHVTKSKLFNEVLEPLTDYLHEINYVGDCNINCIIDEDGIPWPLEFTMRPGWPDMCIRYHLIKSDPIEWMADLLQGKDTLAISEDIAVGVVLSHGDFPTCHDPQDTWAGYPIHGITKRNINSIHFQQVKEGKYPTVNGDETGLLTAGNYLMVVTGSGNSVSEAAAEAYKIAWQIKLPSNLMFRTDIGVRLKKDLPQLHSLGYAKGLEY